MKTFLGLSTLLMFAIMPFASAGSATWSANPTSGDWNTAVNWSPPTVPNGPSDTATFATSSITDLFLSADVELDSTVFDMGASPFTFSIQNQAALTFSGIGLVNNSTAISNISILDGSVTLQNSASAGLAAYIVQAESKTTRGGSMQFLDKSSAGQGVFTTEGQQGSAFVGSSIVFYDSSTAANGSFVNGGSDASVSFGSGGQTLFNDSSSAGNATLDNHAGNVVDGEGGHAGFSGGSSAGTATIVNRGSAVNSNGGSTEFVGGATADHSTIISEPSNGGYQGTTSFYGGTAGNAAFYLEGATTAGSYGGSAGFYGGSADNATFTLTGGSNGGGGGRIGLALKSNGGTARFIMSGNASLDISALSTPTFTTGSLEGEGTVYLGKKTLAVGANNLDTSFSSLLRDGNSIVGAGPGALKKIGTGTFKLTGANTYTGGTIVSAGTLIVGNPDGSATGTGPVQVDSGTFGGGGIVAGVVTVGTGSGAGAVLQPSVGLSQTVTMTLQSSVTFKADSAYTYKLSTQKRKGDELVAKGVTIASGAEFNFTALAKKRLAAGSVFIAISNTSATPISGTFANLPDGSTLTAGRNKLLVSYTGGDGNDLTLTVE